mmetsp:Transcript_25991/g.74557  ORF Transcript_25991/g.74557 Transcript_25991/m.74557 type:complete len:82 (-) Transcript_25991:267-512(-)
MARKMAMDMAKAMAMHMAMAMAAANVRGLVLVALSQSFALCWDACLRLTCRKGKGHGALQNHTATCQATGGHAQCRHKFSS